MYDCHKYLNIPRVSTLSLINVSINEKQARKTFFDPLLTILRGAGDLAFKQFGWQPIDNITLLTDEVKFPKQNIQLLSMNSKAGATEGYNLVLGMADEIDAAEFISVDNIVKTLRTSSNTRFPGGKGKAIVISYKRFIGSSGKIEEYYQQYKDFPSTYVIRGATWDFNPSKTKEMFAEYFKTNPESANIELGSAESNNLVNSWIKDFKRVENSMNKNSVGVLDYPTISDNWQKDRKLETHYTVDEIEYKLDPYNIPIKYNPIEKHHYEYIFICDPGEGSDANGGDAFGITLGHREMVEVVRPQDLGANGVFTLSSDLSGNVVSLEPRPVVDFTFRFLGRMFDEKQIQFSAIEKLVKKLYAYGYNIKIFSFDGYQSISLAQTLSKEHPDSVVYQRNLVTEEDYALLYSSITSQTPPSSGIGEKDSGAGIELPYNPILLWELQNLVVKKGKVDHKSSFSKDVSDTVAKLCKIVLRDYPLGNMVVSSNADRKSETPEIPNLEAFNQQVLRNKEAMDAKVNSMMSLNGKYK